MKGKREGAVWRDEHPSWTSGRFEVKTQTSVDQDGSTWYRLMARRADRNEAYREYRPEPDELSGSARLRIIVALSLLAWAAVLAVGWLALRAAGLVS